MASAAGAYGYARWVEPGWVTVARRGMPLAGLPGPLAGRTLCQVSDLHVGTTDPGHLARCLRVVAALAPDLLAITGDFMSCDRDEQVDAAARALEALPAPPRGCYAVLGNHDYGRSWLFPEVAAKLAARLAGLGVTVLRNESRAVAGLQVAGVDDLWAGGARPAVALAGVDPGRPAVVLCHNPDAVDLPGWDRLRGWVLAGHTHGGQCKAPFLTPPVLPVKNKRYAAGPVDLGGGRHLYVNPGLGYVRKVRFNVRPEVTLFRLVPA